MKEETTLSFRPRHAATLLILSAALVITSPTHATDSTAEMLEAHRLHGCVSLTLDGSALKYKLRPGDSPTSMSSAPTLAARSSVCLSYEDFNPLRVHLSVKDRIKDDESTKAFAKFLESFEKLIGIVKPASANEGLVESLATQLRMEDRKEKLSGLLEAMPTPENVDDWVARAKDREGVRKSLESIVSTRRALGKALANLQEDQIGLAWKRIDDATQMISSLKALEAYLKPFAESTGWRRAEDGTDSAFEFYSHDVDKGKALGLEISVTTINVAVTSGNDESPAGVVILPQKVYEGSLQVRRERVFVFDPAAGLVYSDVRRPKFSAGPVNGVTVVKDDGDEAVGLGAAVFGNFVLRMCGECESPIFPLIQVGLHVDQDSPAILAGGGVRFIGKGKISLTGGAVFGWVKSLDKLHIGDQVSDSEELDRDLHLSRAPVKGYLSIQYNF